MLPIFQTKQPFCVRIPFNASSTGESIKAAIANRSYVITSAYINVSTEGTANVVVQDEDGNIICNAAVSGIGVYRMLEKLDVGIRITANKGLSFTLSATGCAGSVIVEGYVD
jgi:hypothetical protein